MLQLKKITKIYNTGSFSQTALKGINLTFRDSEFVAILGQSGSGKTTLLNILGGLDRYTDGDLVINGVSTKKYTDRDWDVYRNSTIGFIFQSYNLIEHQTVLANVELSLTLNGVEKNERRKRAEEALEKVGLKDHMHKKPNQLSGGQMQRVAIARALVNEPEILLADEPTGALDNETSIQIMDLLREIAEDRLVIMVTHNPELAEKYATRTIKISDGVIIGDTAPVDSCNINENQKKSSFISMSFMTALMLSFNNLGTKKGRTVLTSFAGSIGIIGIALILSLSSGMQAYIDSIEQDTMTAYPITIQSETVDIEKTGEDRMKQMSEQSESESTSDTDTVTQYSNAYDILKSKSFSTMSNNLKKFRNYIEDSSEFSEYVASAEYEYDFGINVYRYGEKTLKVNPSELMNEEDNSFITPDMIAMESMGISDEIWTQLLSDRNLLENQFELVDGKWPENADEVVLILDRNYSVSDLALYTLGIKDSEEFEEIQKAVESDNDDFDYSKYPEESYSYDDFIGLKFKILLPSDYYEKSGDVYIDRSNDKEYIDNKLKNAREITISGIIHPTVDEANLSIQGVIGYTTELRDELIEENNSSQVVQHQLENKNTNIFTNMEFIDPDSYSDDQLTALLPMQQQMLLSSLNSEQKTDYIDAIRKSFEANYESNLERLGYTDPESPSSIKLFLNDFESKDKVVELIDKYNSSQSEDDRIQYVDLVGMMMSSVTEIINLITYLLIGFVSISLVVSSIMIGIITYISVLERTKEIGILRSIGASKKDIGQVFIAESAIIGLAAGIIGIVVTLILDFFANMIIGRLTGVTSLAVLPPAAAAVLIVISLILTVVAGIVPARIASNKDPVTALRSE